MYVYIISVQIKTHIVTYVYVYVFCQDNIQALHLACQMGHSSCVKVLIEDCHADPNCRAKVLCTSVNILTYIHKICFCLCTYSTQAVGYVGPIYKYVKVKTQLTDKSWEKYHHCC